MCDVAASNEQRQKTGKVGRERNVARTEVLNQNNSVPVF